MSDQEMFHVQHQAEREQAEYRNTKIAPAFIKAKKEFSPALKQKTNPAFKSKYADLGACLDAVSDAFLNNGIAVYQETFEVPDGVTVETVLLHESGESLRCGKLHVPASKQDPQGYGSALSYCRRYSLMTACGIAPEDDDGQAASQPRQPAKVSQIKPDNAKTDFGAELKAIAACGSVYALGVLYDTLDANTQHALKPEFTKAKDAITAADLVGQP